MSRHEVEVLCRIEQVCQHHDFTLLKTKKYWKQHEKDMLVLLETILQNADTVDNNGCFSQDILSKVSGYHFAKETLTDSELVMLSLMEQATGVH